MADPECVWCTSWQVVSEWVLIDKPRSLLPLTGIGARFGRGRSITRGGYVSPSLAAPTRGLAGQECGAGRRTCHTYFIPLIRVTKTKYVYSSLFSELSSVFLQVYWVLECLSNYTHIKHTDFTFFTPLLRVTKCNYIFFLLFGIYLIYFLTFNEYQLVRQKLNHLYITLVLRFYPFVTCYRGQLYVLLSLHSILLLRTRDKKYS